MPLPKLPPGAAYIHLHNPSKRNALSLATIRDLRNQLRHHLLPPKTHKRTEAVEPVIFPAFKSHVLDELEADAKYEKEESRHGWLVRPQSWHRLRGHQPHVLVLRSEGPVFCAGHNLAEFAGHDLNEGARREAFNLCAEMMLLIRRSPALVVAAVQGLATGAGCQLALMADVTIALATTKFQLPGMKYGLPSTNSVVGIGQRVPPGLAYRMYATAEPVTAAELGAGVLDVVPVPANADADADAAEQAFEARVASVVAKLAATSGQAQALGKWAFWTQMNMRRTGLREAEMWAARVMALHAKSEAAQEGIVAFNEKRAPVWPSHQMPVEVEIEAEAKADDNGSGKVDDEREKADNDREEAHDQGETPNAAPRAQLEGTESWDAFVEQHIAKASNETRKQLRLKRFGKEKAEKAASKKKKPGKGPRYGKPRRISAK